MRPLPFVLALLFMVGSTADAQLWNPFGSKKNKPRSVQQTTYEAPIGADYRLTQKSGPWLIMASTFSGSGAEDQARDLCHELVSEHGLRAYVHQMTFDFSQEDQQLGRGLDKYGEPIKMRYRSGEKRQEWAVLVGDFPSVDDPIAERQLAQIKHLQPSALALGNDGETSQNFAHIRQAQQAVLERLGKKPAADGPMRTAFLTRNPELPAEYFVPKGVDKFVAKMNKGLDHSLLKAKGKYTVKVATFRGRGVLQGATRAKSSSANRKQRDTDALVEAAENAHLLCEAMRAQGWEAYEFHNRTESYVTVGDFDTLTTSDRDMPINQVKNLASLKPEIIETIRTFGAAFDTPVAPLEKQRNAQASEARVNEVKQTFNQLFTSEVGQVASGMNPKYAQVIVEKGKPPRPVPFDIHPQLIEAPKKTVSSTFAWRR